MVTFLIKEYRSVEDIFGVLCTFFVRLRIYKMFYQDKHLNLSETSGSASTPTNYKEVEVLMVNEEVCCFSPGWSFSVNHFLTNRKSGLENRKKSLYQP
jgi:hypothetical protein